MFVASLRDGLPVLELRNLRGRGGGGGEGVPVSDRFRAVARGLRDRM